MGLGGFACLAASLLMGLWLEHVRERPVYERPSVLIRRAFWLMWSPARWILFAAGWLMMALSVPGTAAGLALVLAALWCWKLYLKSRRHRHRMIREAFLRERERDPAASDVQILRRILHSLHGRWGEELIEQLVADNPTPEGVADMVVRMERGALPAGFSPARMLRGRR